MPGGKLKTESYSNLGGVNQKVSKYTVDETEVLEMINADLVEVNSWTKRDGSTQMAAPLPAPVSGLKEFTKTVTGFSTVLIASGSTIQKLNAGALTSLGTMGTYNAAEPSLADFVVWGDVAWIAYNGAISKTDGTALYNYQMSPPSGFMLPAYSNFVGWTSYAAYPADDLDPMNADGFQVPPTPTLVSWKGSVARNLGGGPVYTYTYLNSSGYIAPLNFGYTNLIAPIGTPGLPSPPATFWSGAFFIKGGAFTFPSNAGITAIVIFRTDISSGQFDYLSSEAAVKSWNWFACGMIPVGSLTANTVFVDTAQGKIGAGGNGGIIGGADTLDATFFADGRISITAAPSIIEEHANSLFMSGFAANPSRVTFSEVAEFETTYPEYFFDVRTENGEIVTAFKSFNSQLIVFKESSFHRVSGTNPTEYQQDEISGEFGCIAKHAVVEADSKLYFLDANGIMVFNGSGFEKVSSKIDPVFARMNLSAAKKTAVCSHRKAKNQILFAIPIDGATQNNFVVVYDYLANSFSFEDGYSATCFATIQQTENTDFIWRGDASGFAMKMSPSFYGDNGQGITATILTPFGSPLGKTDTSIFRQLWLDVDPAPSGATGVITVEIFKNYNKLIPVTTRQVFQSEYQSRCDFGVSAKSIGFRFSHFSASLPLKINGFGVGLRKLRDT